MPHVLLQAAWSSKMACAVEPTRRRARSDARSHARPRGALGWPRPLYAVVYLIGHRPGRRCDGSRPDQDGKDGSGATAVWSGNATWTGVGNSSPLGLSAGTLYATAAVVYDDVALTYSNRVLGTETYTQFQLTIADSTCPTSEGAEPDDGLHPRGGCLDARTHQRSELAH